MNNKRIILSGGGTGGHIYPAISIANELISRDEGLHCDFACLIYGLLQNMLPEDLVHSITHDTVEIGHDFICDAMPCDVIRMDNELMACCIEFVTDRLSSALGSVRLFVEPALPTIPEHLFDVFLSFFYGFVRFK